MTIQDLRKAEIEIIAHVYDDEVAHYKEDAAMVAFIQHCHLFTPEEIKEAQEIFKRIDDLDFARWCA